MSLPTALSSLYHIQASGTQPPAGVTSASGWSSTSHPIPSVDEPQSMSAACGKVPAKTINWGWDDGEPALTSGCPTKLRIEYSPRRISDFIHRGDSLTFLWYHPDDKNPGHEWMEFDFNGK